MIHIPTNYQKFFVKFNENEYVKFKFNITAQCITLNLNHDNIKPLKFKDPHCKCIKLSK